MDSSSHSHYYWPIWDPKPVFTFAVPFCLSPSDGYVQHLLYVLWAKVRDTKTQLEETNKPGTDNHYYRAGDCLIGLKAYIRNLSLILP